MLPTASNATAMAISTRVHIRVEFIGWCFTNEKTRNVPRDIPIEYAINSRNPNGDA